MDAPGSPQGLIERLRHARPVSASGPVLATIIHLPRGRNLTGLVVTGEHRAGPEFRRESIKAGQSTVACRSTGGQRQAIPHFLRRDSVAEPDGTTDRRPIRDKEDTMRRIAFALLLLSATACPVFASGTLIGAK